MKEVEIKVEDAKKEEKNELTEKKGLFQKAKEVPKKAVVGVVAGVVTLIVGAVAGVVYFSKKDEKKSEEENTEAKETAE